MDLGWMKKRWGGGEFIPAYKIALRGLCVWRGGMNVLRNMVAKTPVVTESLV